MVTIDIGKLRQEASLFNPGIAIPDGDGGFTQMYTPLDPPLWRCAIQVASVRASERHFSGTVIAQASHILSGRFHVGITTETRIVWVDRAGETHTANVLDVDDTEGAGVETVALVSEVVDSETAAARMDGGTSASTFVGLFVGLDGGTPPSVFAGAGVEGGGA